MCDKSLYLMFYVDWLLIECPSFYLLKYELDNKQCELKKKPFRVCYCLKGTREKEIIILSL